ncbi:hypothetical protein CF394_10520 [Tetzosporium hominis]|uniref:Uncharacterized protein n=1 Tax=Tetzosporium hominis TaxID=2020506 RepID=A0A264W254_9BACL|nr:hypothetical protein CF394_10520 [Tetzosporium hominis]
MISGIDLILQETAPRSTAHFITTFFAVTNMGEGEGNDTRSVVSEWFEEPAVGGQSAMKSGTGLVRNFSGIGRTR